MVRPVTKVDYPSRNGSPVNVMRLELWRGSYERLSPAQRAFAEKVHAADFAVPGPEDDGVYLYREAGGWYERWLLDSGAHVLEHVSVCERPRVGSLQ